MRILVCGGRDYLDYNYLRKTLSEILYQNELTVDDVIIIQGGAKGADFLAKCFSYCYGWGGIMCEEYPADWKKYGRGAGHIRNQQMLDEGKPDLVVAFPGGRGTNDMVTRAKNAGVAVMEV